MVIENTALVTCFVLISYLKSFSAYSINFFHFDEFLQLKNLNLCIHI